MNTHPLVPKPIIVFYRGKLRGNPERPSGVTRLTQVESAALPIHHSRVRENNGPVGRIWKWIDTCGGLYVEHIRNEDGRPVLRVSRIALPELYDRV